MWIQRYIFFYCPICFVLPVSFFPSFVIQMQVMDKIMVYTPLLTARAEYIFSLVFNELMGIELIMTSQRDQYETWTGPCIEYCTEPSGHGIFLCSCALLAEESVKPQYPKIFTFSDRAAFFGVQDERSAFPFDLFAAAFYLVTRYEEYLPFETDKYGRFPASESIATAGDFLAIPIVNLWTGLLQDYIRKGYPSLQFREKKFRFIPTVDIDHAYAFKERSLIRTLGGYGRDLAKGKLGKITRKTKVLLGYLQDPYDQYDYISDIHQKYGLRPLWFLLFANYGKDDNNVSLSGRKFQELVKHLDGTGNLGIHPSLTSGGHPEILSSEISGLSKLLGRALNASRQHFLKVSFPDTYRELIRQGITDDYSLGYAGNPGFRAGIADPFPFFDLLTNRAEKLMLHPVQLMDVTLKDYLKSTPDEAMATIRRFTDTIKAVNGEFVSVWHNESFDETGRWKGWREVYNYLLSYGSGRINIQ